MVQVELAILFNDNFGMKRLHNAKSVTCILLFNKRGKGAFRHFKVVVADNFVISGSANVSRNSQRVLDEAAILTTDSAAVRRAREFIDRICTEPVRAEYLEKCKQIYRPPHSKRQGASGKDHQTRATHAKLWIVNLGDYRIPDRELKRYSQGRARAEKMVKDEARSTTDCFHYSHKPRMATELELGDWIIQIVRYDYGEILVFPPGRLLYIDHFVRNMKTGTERWVFHLEVPQHGKKMPWKEFRAASKSALGNGTKTVPRTKPVRDVQAADSLLSLWTAGGRIARH